MNYSTHITSVWPEVLDTRGKTASKELIFALHTSGQNLVLVSWGHSLFLGQ